MKSKKPKQEDELLSTEDAGRLAGRNARTICRWFDAGLITGESMPYGVRVVRRVSRVSLEKYLASR